jgi:hypothetical protein
MWVYSMYTIHISTALATHVRLRSLPARQRAACSLEPTGNPRYSPPCDPCNLHPSLPGWPLNCRMPHADAVSTPSRSPSCVDTC